MGEFRLTVFTAPLVPKQLPPPGIYKSAKFYLKLLIKWIISLKNKHATGKLKYGGHYGVTRSLCEGLARQKVSFNYNPGSEKSIFENVIVLDGVEVLHKCIELKTSGKIKKLFAGPNLMVRSNEYENVLGNTNIDRVIVPSEWVKIFYIDDQPSLENKIIIWPAGVDENAFRPVASKPKKGKILVYQKNGPEELVNRIIEIIRVLGFTEILIRYGSYDKVLYKQLLNEVEACVFISKSESQGLAMLEAWSMNVPTLVWQNNEPLVINNKSFEMYSAAPYLSDQTGVFFTSLQDFEGVLYHFKNDSFEFEPRNWVIKNMTDSKVASNLINEYSCI